MVMTKGQLIKAVDETRVREAVERAERRTSGEIVVSVSGLFLGDVEKAAHRAFARLGVAQTRDRNGILIFVAPARRRFMVLGDVGIHERVGQEFWNRIAAQLSEHFRRSDFTEGLVRAIESIGEQLGTHFPYDAEGDINELSNDVDFGV
ncbi:MAG TPA: TPM domain-containing protein [Terriglobia bacterium]|nr:TPM domain-containing protein [Terriglobia bacterium]